MKKILLIVTKGCEACNIQENLLKQGIKISGKDIEYEKQDVEDVSRNWLKYYNITDFPTTLLFKDDKLLFKYTGTRPAIVNCRFIDVNY